MGKVAKAWVGTAIAAAGLAIAYWVPVAGVVVAVAGVIASLFSTVTLNVPAARAATVTALVLNAAAVFVATGSSWLSLSVLLPLMVSFPNELVMRHLGGALNFTPMVGLLSGLVLLGVGWPSLPSPWWAFVLLPHALLTGERTVVGLRTRSEHLQAMTRTRVVVGEPLPVDVVLPSRDGQPPFSLKEHLGQFVLLVFVRGDWCPVCQVMMRIVSREAPTLKRHGVRVAIVSPSEGQMDDEAVQRLGLVPGMLYDENNALARALGLLEPGKKDGKDITLPVTILIDKQGIVRNVTRPDDVTDFASERRVLAILEGLPAAA